ncbi:MAG: ABC transporter permease [Pseudomonadota bacterium]
MFIDTEKWQEIFLTLKQHKLRTGLTAFGVFWGIFMLAVLLGAGKGLENGVMEEFKEIPNSVWIWSQGNTQIAYQGMPIGRRMTLKAEDVEAIKNNIPDVDKIYAQNSLGIWGGSPAYTVYKSKNGSFSIQGTHAGMANIHQQKMLEGRYINEIDDEKRRKVAIIGTRVKELIFPVGENAVGANITISGISFQVIGVFKSSSTNPNSSETEKIYIPNDTLRYAFNQVNNVGSFVIVPKAGVHAEIVEKDVKKYLHAIKKIDPNDSGVIGSFNLQKEFDKISGLFTGINVFSWIVAIGTIMAGAIGVGNIMLIVVKERTREIGLRKALGATPSSIIGMIVQESIFITAMAGYFGLVCAVLLLELVNRIMDATGGHTGMFRHPAVDFKVAIVALVILVISGFLASLLPASKAAAVNPIVALQDE